VELRRTGIRLGLLGLLAVATAACGAAASDSLSKSPAVSSSTTSVSTTTLPVAFATDATVTIAVTHLPSNLNPWTTGGSDPVAQMVMAQVLPQVSIVNNELQTEVCTVTANACPSALLTSAEPISLDPMTVVYQIAPKATWSNGVPITGADFSYLRAEVLAHAASLPATVPINGYQDISSIATSNKGKTVTIVFAKPYSDWQSLFSNLLPSSVATANGFDAAFATSPANLTNLVSAGPYRISHIIAGREIVLVRNPAYWGSSANIARIIFRVEPTVAATIAALRANKVTVAQLPPAQIDHALIASTTDLVGQTSFTPQLWQLVLNLGNTVVGNASLREAIADAVDRTQLLNDTAQFAEGMTAAVTNRIFGLGIGGGASDDANYVSVNDVGAEAALVAAGYSYDADGVADDAAGKPLVLHLVGPEGSMLMAGVEAQIQAELLQVGVRVSISNVPLSRLLGSTLATGSYQLALAPFDVSPYLSTNAAVYLPATYLSPATPTTSTVPSVAADHPVSASTGLAAAPAAVASSAVTRDVFSLDDPTLAPLFAQAFSELDPSAANDVYNEIDLQLWRDLPTIPILQTAVTTIANNALQGLLPSQSPASFMYNAENWSWELNAPPTVTTTTTVVPTSP
jgi:peptide/nickel transport system substrate-binding protein